MCLEYGWYCYYKKVAKNKTDPVHSESKNFQLKRFQGSMSSEKSPISAKVRVEKRFTNPKMSEVSLQIIREEMILKENTPECGKK